MEQMQETSQQILSAATRRFMHYGYMKTTMSEIARDLSMSTGNLYRFFPSKLDIAEAIAEKIEIEESYTLEQIANSNIAVDEKLRRICFRILKDSFEHIAQNKKIFEIVQVISEQRPQFAEKKLSTERKLLVNIFEEGVVKGIFKSFISAENAMLAFQHATMRYRYPQLHSNNDLETLSVELDLVLDLIFNGLMLDNS